MKSTYPIAFATTMLAWGLLDYNDAYVQPNEHLKLMSNLKWSANYLIACHIDTNKLVAQVGNYNEDLMDWKRAEEIEPEERSVYIIDDEHPSPEIVAEAAAALSAVGLVFKSKGMCMVL